MKKENTDKNTDKAMPHDALLSVVLSKWNDVPDSEKQWLQFCFECNQPTSYAELDTCENCKTKYKPSGTDEKCPKCSSTDFISHCEKCGARLDASYLDELLRDKDFEWSENELKAILNYLNNR